jgi:hypothetical protein
MQMNSSGSDETFINGLELITSQTSAIKVTSDLCESLFPNVKDMIRSQWKLVQGHADEFWSKWTKEYMHTLQTTVFIKSQ